VAERDASRSRLLHMDGVQLPLFTVRLARLHRKLAPIITNVLTCRPARGIVNRFMREEGPIDRAAPNFLRSKSGSQGLHI
jgi:hypothetical protein